MNLKELRRGNGRQLGWLGFLFCSLIVRFLTVRSIYVVAKSLSRVGFFFAKRHRSVALESLSIAFGQEKTPQELRHIAKDCFTYMANSVIETLFLMSRPQLLKERVTLENKEILDTALSKTKGVILVSGHFGNFPLMILRLRLEGYLVGAIMRPMRDRRIEKTFGKLRDKLGIKAIHSQPRKACVERTIKALKNNEVVCFQIDQNFGTGGIFVDFFGRKSATATGPVVFSLRTKAAILPGFIVRNKDNTHRVIFEQEFDLKQEGNFDKTVMVNIQRLTEIIESYIRQYPAHWGWIHRRWKTRPKQNGSNIVFVETD